MKNFSLLAPEGDFNYFKLGEDTANDLSIDFIIKTLTSQHYQQEKIKEIFLKMPIDSAVIKYRKEIYNDLVNSPSLCDELCEILNQMRFYTSNRTKSLDKQSTIWEFISRLKELENYCLSIIQMKKCLDNKVFQSKGMNELKDFIELIYNDSGFNQLSEDIKQLGEDLSGIKSMTLGVNFDDDLYPQEVGIISMNNNYIKEQGILDRFIKFHKSRNIEDKDLKNVNMIMHPQNSQINNSPLMNNLTSIVEKMLPKIVEPLKRILRKYSDVSGLALTILEDEFMFYAKFIELEKRITQAGMNCCSGEISDNETSFTELYNIKLGMCYLNDDIQNDIVSNDLDFMNDHQILILTGANRGGKTVFTQGIGLAFLLFQHGLFVPCKSCKLQLCDGIYTHFPVDENHTVSLGRLGEEAKRFNYICMNATKNSLLLLNESFATTSHSESLYIATDAVKYLCCLGARTCYNTHMHELAENLDELYKTQNAVCKAVSVVMGSGDNMRSYMIHFSKPNGKSYAHDIAYKFGITFEQLCQMNRK